MNNRNLFLAVWERDVYTRGQTRPSPAPTSHPVPTRWGHGLPGASFTRTLRPFPPGPLWGPRPSDLLAPKPPPASPWGWAPQSRVWGPQAGLGCHPPWGSVLSGHQAPGSDSGTRSPAPEATDQRPRSRALAAPLLSAFSPACCLAGCRPPCLPSSRDVSVPGPAAPMACQSPSLPWTQELAPSCPPGVGAGPGPSPVWWSGPRPSRGAASRARASEPPVLTLEAVSSHSF